MRCAPAAGDRHREGAVSEDNPTNNGYIDHDGLKRDTRAGAVGSVVAFGGDFGR